jgi:hypothetical protein
MQDNHTYEFDKHFHLLLICSHFTAITVQRKVSLQFRTIL